MANWTTATPTRDQALSDDYNYGSWRQMAFFQNIAASSADNGLSSGAGITASRMSNPIIAPSVTTPTTGYCITQLDIFCNNNANGVIVGLEFPLGTLTVSGNVFSAGASMPTRTVAGSSLQLGALMAFLVCTTTSSSTTPIITFTYTNQSGVTGQTGTITLPTNCTINSAFLLNRKLQSGDTAIQAITNMSISTGITGVFKIYGLMPISFGGQSSSSGTTIQTMEPLSSPLPIIKCIPNDVISVYQLSTGNFECIVNLIATPEQ